MFFFTKWLLLLFFYDYCYYYYCYYCYYYYYYYYVQVWMCGGSVEVHPCSHVGHVYQTKIPYSFPRSMENSVKRNLVRLAEVWLDDHKQFYYNTISYRLVSRNVLSQSFLLTIFSLPYKLSQCMTKPTMAYAHSEDSDQPGHPSGLIRIFPVRMKKAWVFSYPFSAQRRL